MSSLEASDALSLALRAVSFVLLLNAAGVPVFIAVFGHLSQAILPTVARLGVRFAVAALVFVTAHHLMEAARMAGEMTGVMDMDMQATALHSSEGAAFVVRAVGLACILAALSRGRAVLDDDRSNIRGGGSGSGARGGESRVRDGSSGERGRVKLTANAIALIGSLLALGSFTLTGHTSVTLHRLAAATLLLLHLLLVAFWLGALWPLYFTASRAPATAGAALVEEFSRKALILVPIILLAGVGLAALLLPDLSAFKQPYGQLLLAKAALFALLMALAALNKWRFGPVLRIGDTQAFKRTVIAEYILIGGVLAVTATMTMLYSPEAP
jgi:putative copper resistance protein D